VPIHGCIKSTDQFPIQKSEIFCKFKDIRKLRRSLLAQATEVIQYTRHVLDPPLVPFSGLSVLKLQKEPFACSNTRVPKLGVHSIDSINETRVFP
jgi:hypothetical protein